jgi:insulysin
MNLRGFCLGLLSLWIGFGSNDLAGGFFDVENQAKTPILTPSFKDVKFGKIRLDNGLEAYLISDPQARQSSASMTVKVGSWQEPEEFPGTAHFLEHMLFLGTEKYPNESEYDRFISQNGGTMNAYTARDHTTYLFAIDNNAFLEALDRFSWFFKAPLFNPSGVEREKRAVDQEFSKNVENDEYRESMVRKIVSNQKHPFSRFKTGNYETLSKISQDTLKQWYAKSYGSNRMHLVIYSPMPLDELKNIVDASFSDVKRVEGELPVFPESISDPAYNTKITVTTPVKDLRRLTMVWELPGKFAKMIETQPDSLASMVLGHEGEESLLAQLKREGLAEGLSSGGYPIGNDHFQFAIETSLTEKGLKEWHHVVERVLATITALQKEGIPQRVFDEMKKLDTVDYQYQERIDPFVLVTRHAEGLLREGLESYPEKTMIPQTYDEAAVNELLGYLTVDTVQFSLLANGAPIGVDANKTEPWTGAKYQIAEIPAETITFWKGVEKIASIGIPQPNPFIPENLTVKTVLAPEYQIPKPVLLTQDEGSKIYFTPDTFYQSPEAYIALEVKTPAVKRGDPLSFVLGDLFVKSLNESLNGPLYEASLAGLAGGVSRTEEGFQVDVSGYAEKAPKLLDAILTKMKGLEISEEKFAIYKEALDREYQNFAKELPVRQVFEPMKSVMYERYVTEKEKARALSGVDYQKFRAFVEGALKNVYLEGMLYGNLTEEDARAIHTMVKAALGGEIYAVADQIPRKVVSLPAAHGPYFLTERTKQQGNAVVLLIDHGQADLKSRAALEVLSIAIQQPFYTDLRTRQQTAYMVYNDCKEVENHLYSFFAIQSNTHNGRDLLARFELSLEGFLQEMNKEGGLSPAEFETIKQSQLTQLRQPLKNVIEMGQLLKQLAFDYDGDFDRITKRIAGTEELDFAGFMEFAKKFYGKGNKSRFAILLTGEIPEDGSLNYLRARNIGQMRKFSKYAEAKRP